MLRNTRGWRKAHRRTTILDTAQDRRLRVVSSFPLGDRRESSVEWARKNWGEDKNGERGEGRRRETEGKKETTDNPLFKNLHGRWWPQYSDWPVLAFPSTGPTTWWHLEFRDCYDGLQFRERFKIETTTRISMHAWSQKSSAEKVGTSCSQ